MISIDFIAVTKAMLFSMVFGLVTGVIFELLISIFHSAKTIFFKKGKSSYLIRNKFNFCAFLCDFLLTLGMGISYLIILFVTADGVFLLLPLLLLLLFLFLGRKSVSALIGKRK